MFAEAAELGDGGDRGTPGEGGHQAEGEQRDERVLSAATGTRVSQFGQAVEWRQDGHGGLRKAGPTAYLTRPTSPTSTAEQPRVRAEWLWNSAENVLLQAAGALNVFRTAEKIGNAVKTMWGGGRVAVGGDVAAHAAPQPTHPDTPARWRRVRGSAAAS